MGPGFELYGLRKNGTEIPVEISLSAQTIDESVYISSTIQGVGTGRITATLPSLTAPLSSK